MEPTGRSDERLAALCQTGDYAAFEELYERYQRPILGYLYQITRSYEDSACIAQDVFLKVFAHVDRYDPARRFSTWFYTIARNAAIDWLHARQRRPMVTFSDADRDDDGGGIAAGAVAPLADVAERLARAESGALLAAALDALPQIYREIIELVIFQEKTYEEAAEILGGVSLGTLRSRMFHALRRLRAQLERPGGPAGDDLL